MADKKKTSIRIIIVVALLIAAAVVIRYLGMVGVIPSEMGIVRSFIYIGIFSAWRVSIARRIIQPQVRRYLTEIAILLIFWIAERSVKYYFNSDPTLNRALWYLFYAPMLFVPLLSLYVSVTLRKPEDYKLPGWMWALGIPTTALLLLVLTNDFHQLVFAFPESEVVWTGYVYSYGIAYWFVSAWEIALSAAALIIMLIKCRAPNSKKPLWLPFIPCAVLFLYSFFYITGATWLKTIAGDMAVFFCLSIAAILESCIQCGLICVRQVGSA